MHNLIIAGIGGQGINRLAHIIATTCYAVGKSCQFTVHKGGAQTLGSVYVEMRIAAGTLPVLGPGIPNGKLDLLVALDPWEGLRHIKKAHATTKAWVETSVAPMFVERQNPDEHFVLNTNPLDCFADIPVELHYQAYRQTAIETCGQVRMANYFAGMDCLQALGISEIARYQQIFFEQIPSAVQHRRSVLQ